MSLGSVTRDAPTWTGLLYTEPVEHRGSLYYTALDFDVRDLPFHLAPDADPFVTAEFYRLLTESHGRTESLARRLETPVITIENSLPSPPTPDDQSDYEELTETNAETTPKTTQNTIIDNSRGDFESTAPKLNDEPQKPRKTPTLAKIPSLQIHTALTESPPRSDKLSFLHVPNLSKLHPLSTSSSSPTSSSSSILNRRRSHAPVLISASDDHGRATQSQSNRLSIYSQEPSESTSPSVSPNRRSRAVSQNYAFSSNPFDLSGGKQESSANQSQQQQPLSVLLSTVRVDPPAENEGSSVPIHRVPSKAESSVRSDENEPPVSYGRRKSLWGDLSQARQSASRYVRPSEILDGISDEVSEGGISRMSESTSAYPGDEQSSHTTEDRRRSELYHDELERAQRKDENEKKPFRFLHGFRHKQPTAQTSKPSHPTDKYKIIYGDEKASNLKNETVSHVQSIPGNENALLVMSFNTAGTFLAAGDDKGYLIIWKVFEESLQSNRQEEEDIVSRVPTHIFKAHGDCISDLCWCENEDILLTASGDQTVKLWLLTDARLLKTFEHGEPVTCVSFHPLNRRLFISGCINGHLSMWDIIDEKIIQDVYTGGTISATIITKDGQTTIVGFENGIFKMYETEKFEYLKSHEVAYKRGLKTKAKKIAGFGLTNSGDKLLVSSCDSRVRLYNLSNLSLFCKYKGHQVSNCPIRASFGPNDENIIMGSENFGIYSWGTKYTYQKRSLKYNERRDQNKSYEKIEGPNQIITCACYHPTQGRLIFSADAGGNIHIFRRSPATPITEETQNLVLSDASKKRISETIATNDAYA